MQSTNVDPLAGSILADYGLAITLANRILNDVDEARETVQESVYRALLHAHTFDASRPVRPWFLRIVRNVAINERKRRSKFGEMPDLVDYTSPAEAAIGSERRQLARTLVARLPESYRAVVHLRYDREYQYQDISRALRIPIGTTKTILHRAHKALRTAYINTLED